MVQVVKKLCFWSKCGFDLLLETRICMPVWHSSNRINKNASYSAALHVSVTIARTTSSLKERRKSTDQSPEALFGVEWIFWAFQGSETRRYGGCWTRTWVMGEISRRLVPLAMCPVLKNLQLGYCCFQGRKECWGLKLDPQDSTSALWAHLTALTFTESRAALNHFYLNSTRKKLWGLGGQLVVYSTGDWEDSQDLIWFSQTGMIQTRG